MNPKNYECRLFSCEFRASESDGNQITGYGAVFNSLSENLGGFREIIKPGAFDDVLTDDVRALINHDNNLVLGRTAANTLSIGVDNTGLKYSIDLPETSYAKDLRISIDRGDINQSSFGFTVESDDWQEDEEGRLIRTINKVGRLFDVSPVTYPAYPDTSAAVRSMEQYKTTLSQSTQIELEKRKRELDLLKIA